jgi:hypothetical protein
MSHKNSRLLYSHLLKFRHFVPISSQCDEIGHDLENRMDITVIFVSQK